MSKSGRFSLKLRRNSIW